LHDLIGETRTDGVVFVAGDRPSATSTAKPKGRLPFVEVKAPGPARAFAAANEIGPNRSACPLTGVMALVT
jgi:hypothetical protein